MENSSYISNSLLEEVEKRLEEGRRNLLQKAFSILEFNFDPALYSVVPVTNEYPFLFNIIETSTDQVLFDISLHPSLETLVGVKFKFDDLELVEFLKNDSIINSHIAHQLKLLKVFNHLNNEKDNKIFETINFDVHSYGVDVSFYLNSVSFECKNYTIYTYFKHIKSKWYLTEPILAYLDSSIEKLLKDKKIDVNFDLDIGFNPDSVCDLIDMYKI